jgi:hypothetical protein
MEIAILLLAGLSFLVGIGSFVCWIMVVIKAFQNEESPLLGILCIVLCGLGAFVIGWIKNTEWRITQLMMIWTGLFVGSIVLQIVLMAVGAAAGAALQ